jgi:hypothetical protein
LELRQAAEIAAQQRKERTGVPRSFTREYSLPDVDEENLPILALVAESVIEAVDVDVLDWPAG